MNMPFDTLLWLFTAGVAVHNLEEAMWLPAWSASAGRWHRPVSRAEFRFAVLVLTLVLLAAAVAVSVAPPGSWASYLFFGYVFAMVANVFVPHVAASLALRTYMPGTASALLLNLPLGALLLRQGFRSGRIEAGIFAVAGPLVALGILASIPLLFWIGRRFAARPGRGSETTRAS